MDNLILVFLKDSWMHFWFLDHMVVNMNKIDADLVLMLELCHFQKLILAEQCPPRLPIIFFSKFIYLFTKDKKKYTNLHDLSCWCYWTMSGFSHFDHDVFSHFLA